MKIPGKPLTDKVKEGILETPYFIPILTRSSITSQWVNQEIDFAIATDRNPKITDNNPSSPASLCVGSG